MAFYRIGDVAERCGINPVTLRAWQRRYGLLKPQRSEGGHRQFDEEDIQRIEEIKRWIKNGIPVGKVKALLEGSESVVLDQSWSTIQDSLLTVLRQVRSAGLRSKIKALARENTPDALIDNVFLPVRQRLSLDQNTARAMCSLLDGVLIEFIATCLAAARREPGKEALLIGWETDDPTRLWLEAWRLSRQGWHIDVLADPLDAPHPEFFPGQQIMLWTGKTPTPHQQEQLKHWREQGYTINFHNS
ncbi:helix-turn-helix-type transcriptional regulator [Pluralibacter gergoviae]|uniref:MerR family transcriptional regulator n=1 Tax=Pluralibacter gergoviae TaxID=61647 RepID=UPI0004F7D778|nr:MerR family transcriptional regulator [Pluralibacter gergoviae]AIR01919.1 helix-turn-helix-type transcriptional regulator [Pluralibacter gergoviae]